MTLYKVRKGNVSFFIQPSMVESYHEMGYEIIKFEEVAVKNIAQEVQAINEEMKIQSTGAQKEDG